VRRSHRGGSGTNGSGGGDGPRPPPEVKSCRRWRAGGVHTWSVLSPVVRSARTLRIRGGADRTGRPDRAGRDPQLRRGPRLRTGRNRLQGTDPHRRSRRGHPRLPKALDQVGRDLYPFRSISRLVAPLAGAADLLAIMVRREVGAAARARRPGALAGRRESWSA